MVDVFVFKGKFDAQVLNNDPTYGAYFNQRWIIKIRICKIHWFKRSNFLAQYTGSSLIPEFKMQEGRQLYIETLINLEARRTGLFCAVKKML
jgi:hypothetical protein